MFAPGLYAIADADHTPDVVAWGERLLESGVRTLQLRAKNWEPSEITAAAHTLVVSARRHGAMFILNDHPEIAAAVGAHGVHLGQTDMDPKRARGIVGAEMLIGLSTHTIAQVMQTRGGASGADYLGFGPVFTTTSKVEADTARGPDQLREAVSAADLPVVAIGGISPSNIRRVIDAGPHAWATISALSGQDGLHAAIRELTPAP